MNTYLSDVSEETDEHNILTNVGFILLIILIRMKKLMPTQMI